MFALAASVLLEASVTRLAYRLPTVELMKGSGAGYHHKPNKSLEVTSPDILPWSYHTHSPTYP